MTIEKTNEQTNEFELEGTVKFAIAGYPTVEEWVENEPEDSVRSLLLDLFEQLK